MEGVSRHVMSAIYDKCETKGAAIFSPLEILEAVPYRYALTDKDIPTILRMLEIEDYIEVTSSVKMGKNVFLISLKQKGLAFKLEQRERKNKVVFRICWTVLFAVLGFFVKLLLDSIF